jgi:hypothetical protein
MRSLADVCASVNNPTYRHSDNGSMKPTFEDEILMMIEYIKRLKLLGFVLNRITSREICLGMVFPKQISLEILKTNILSFYVEKH